MKHITVHYSTVLITNDIDLSIHLFTCIHFSNINHVHKFNVYIIKSDFAIKIFFFFFFFLHVWSFQTYSFERARDNTILESITTQWNNVLHNEINMPIIGKCVNVRLSGTQHHKILKHTSLYLLEQFTYCTTQYYKETDGHPQVYTHLFVFLWQI